LVDGRTVDLALGARRLEQLRDEGGDTLLGDVVAVVARRELGLRQDLVEQRAVEFLDGCGLGLLRYVGFSHCLWPPCSFGRDVRASPARQRNLFVVRRRRPATSRYWSLSGFVAAVSSASSFSRAASSPSTPWIALRNAGTLPSGPFSATSASRS